MAPLGVANPYARPQSDPSQQPLSAEAGPALRRATRALVVLLVLGLCVRLGGIFFDLRLDSWLRAAEFGLEEDASPWRAGLGRTLGARWLSWVLAVPAWWLWTWTAQRAARGHGLELRHGGLAAVGWWFVPIANLFMPLRVLAELWCAAADPRPVAWRRQSFPSWIVLWWLSLLAIPMLGAALVEQVADFFLGGVFDDSVTAARMHAIIRRDVALNGLVLVAGGLALVIVTRISAGLLEGPR